MSAAAKWEYLKEQRYKSMYPPTNKDVLQVMRAAGWPGTNQGNSTYRSLRHYIC